MEKVIEYFKVILCKYINTSVISTNLFTCDTEWVFISNKKVCKIILPEIIVKAIICGYISVISSSFDDKSLSKRLNISAIDDKILLLSRLPYIINLDISLYIINCFLSFIILLCLGHIICPD